MFEPESTEVTVVFRSLTRAMAHQPIQEQHYRKKYPGTFSRLGIRDGGRYTVTYFLIN